MADVIWENLLDKAITCLDSCSNEFPEFMRWSLGGGTALMLQLWHRRSKDIDIFVNYVEALPLLSPRLNNKVDALAHDYIEAQNFVKLKLAQGEIDFIVAPHLTRDPWHEVSMRGRTILLETPWEIVVMKLPKTHYYDAVCVGRHLPETTAVPFVDVYTAIGRGNRQMAGVDKHGFPIRHREPKKIHHGFQTGDLVVADVPKGKYKGHWCDRVAVRATGYFDIKNGTGKRVCQGIPAKYCRLVQSANGWQYERKDSG